MGDIPTLQNKRRRTWLIILIVVILLAVVVSLPPVWTRVSYHSREVYRTVKYWIKPPSQAVFVPSTLDDDPAITSVSPENTVNAPIAQPTTRHTPQITAASTELIPETTLTPAPTPTLNPTSLPSAVLLTGVSCERQLMNNCGPATLSMYLSYYDWGKNQLATAAVLKPNGNDVNVMPYELVDFVNEHTDLNALWRYGGDLQTIKTLVNAGFPVMIEKGFEP